MERTAAAALSRKAVRTAHTTYLWEGSLSQLGQNKLRQSLLFLPEVLYDLFYDPRSHLSMYNVVAFDDLPVDLVREELLAILARQNKTNRPKRAMGRL